MPLGAGVGWPLAHARDSIAVLAWNPLRAMFGLLVHGDRQAAAGVLTARRQ
jgi:hypothetical protein